ncbi:MULTISPECIES: MBL fold metallo-hydrolase [Paenibacillus]|uniref:MBL fold metallo-hydrolase n=1 Tax=Paenibacillus residui TaxID=629724 RepID=A0ABW3DH06_9BACL
MHITTLGSWGAYPAAQSATSGYLLESGTTRILVDCGSGVLAQLQRYTELEWLDAVVLSHSHTDHIADVYCLQYAIMILTELGKRSRPLDIYAHIEEPERMESLNYPPYCRAYPIDAGDRLTIGDVRFQFGRNVHPVSCLSMRIEHQDRSIAYTADTEWHDGLVELSRGADMLLSECSLYNQQFGKIRGHLTAGEAGRLAALADAGRLVLTHLPHYGDHQTLVRQAQEHYSGPVQLTYTGDCFVI